MSENEENTSVRIDVWNYSDAVIKLNRVGSDDPVQSAQDEGNWIDWWQLKWDSEEHCYYIALVSPTRSQHYRGAEGDRYIVFKDRHGDYRFAYIGKDGYVIGNARDEQDPNCEP